LQPLVDLAADRHAALIGITHFTKGTEGKNPVERVTGSLAFGALARVVLAAGASGEDGTRRFVRAASNIGPDGGGFEYKLVQEDLWETDDTAQRVWWGRYVAGRAADLLGDANTQSEILKAVSFIEAQLESGHPVPVNELKQAAAAHSLAWRTVQRAREKLGAMIVAERTERYRTKPSTSGGVNEVTQKDLTPGWCWRMVHAG
jgi:hypothetical protein